MGALTRVTLVLVAALCALIALAQGIGGQLSGQPVLAYAAHRNPPSGPRTINLYAPGRQIAVTITQALAYPLDVAAAPDRHHLALVNRTDTGDRLTVLNPYTGGQRLLVERLEIDSATWSPDGERIAYETQRNLHIVDTLTGEHQQTFGTPPVVYPRWSPGGDVIAVLVYPDVYTLDIDTGGFTQLINLPQARRAFTLAWSADGRYLAYTMLPQDPDVYIYDTHTAHMQRVRLLQLITVREIAWRDATRLTVVGGRTSIMPAAAEIDITTGEVTRFALPPDYNRELSWLR